MRVLHFCYRYFPDRGGSETYVSSLIRGLRNKNVGTVIVSAGVPECRYSHDGIEIHRIGHPEQGSIGSQAIASESSLSFNQKLAAKVQELRPDVVHFHWHPKDSSKYLEACGIPTMLTYHHPAISCHRGDLIRNGKAPCHGKFSTEICLPCVARNAGAPPVIADLLSKLPPAFGPTIASLLTPSRIRTALCMGADICRSLAETTEFLHVQKRVVVLSSWTRNMLIECGLSPERVVLSRLGTHHNSLLLPERSKDRHNQTVRGIFVGRLDAVKGVHLLAEAMRRRRGKPIEVDIYGPLENIDAHLREIVMNPPRGLKFMGSLRDDLVVETMARYDFATIPSQFFETGPYTVIEAFQAGLPVVGTDLGGIGELVTHDVNGWLIPLGSLSGWVETLDFIAENHEILTRWRENACWSRTMDNVAAEMTEIYAQVAIE